MEAVAVNDGLETVDGRSLGQIYQDDLRGRLLRNIKELDLSIDISTDKKPSEYHNAQLRELIKQSFVKMDRFINGTSNVSKRPHTQRTQYFFLPEGESTTGGSCIYHLHGFASLPTKHDLTKFEMFRALSDLDFDLQSKAYQKFGLVSKKNRRNHRFSMIKKLDAVEMEKKINYATKFQDNEDCFGMAIWFGEMFTPSQ